MACPKSVSGYLYDYDSEKEILPFTPRATQSSTEFEP